MATANIQIKGLDELVKKLDSLDKLEAIKPAMRASALHVKGKVDQYPPASEANSPQQKRWYERGYGPKWRRADGSIGGKRTSETLGRKWTMFSADWLTWRIGNNVSYGPYVQDQESQASFHKRRGWKTTQTVAEEEEKTVLEFIKKEVDKELAK